MALAPTWKLIISAALCMLGIRVLAGASSMVEKHEQWMARYGRIYKDELEKARRFEIFKNNVEFIESFNEAMTRPYKLAINKFADLTYEETRASRNGIITCKPPKVSSPFRYANVTDADVPSSMDWWTRGAVTAVKDQGQVCASGWAFTAVAAVEGINQITTGNLVSLSEQELVDCDTSDDQSGFRGGEVEYAYEFIIKSHGLRTESDYPYQGVYGTCNTSEESPRAARITGYEQVPANSEASLLKAVANQPVAVHISSNGYSFQFYSSGVFMDECGTDLDHTVTVVGYGVTNEGTKYWLVKNSWGEDWGESGYIRMQRDIDAAEGLCGIAIQPSYPTMYA